MMRSADRRRFTYEAAHRPRRTSTNCSEALNLSYGHESLNNVISLTDPRANATHTSVVDSLNRLRWGREASRTLIWACKKGGTRISETAASATTTHQCQASRQRLTSTTRVTPGKIADAAAERLAALDLCRQRSVGVTGAAIQVLILFLLFIGARARPAEAQQAELLEYYASDAVGSIRVVFQPNGTVLGRRDFMPFGRPTVSDGEVLRLQFQGQESDPEIAQTYFHARMFSPRVARFGAVDPIDESQRQRHRWNRYIFALGNPLRFQDPTGMTAKETTPESDGYSCEFILGINKRDNRCAPSPETSGPLMINLGLNVGSGAQRRSQYARNNTKNVIFAKPSEGETPVEIKPGATYDGDTDGIADPCSRPGEVFKNVDFTDVTVTPSTTVATPATGLVGVPPAAIVVMAFQALRGGWKGEEFRQEHKDWRPLFEASKINGQCNK